MKQLITYIILFFALVATMLGYGAANPPRWIDASNDVIRQLDTTSWTDDEKTSVITDAMMRILVACDEDGEEACYRSKAGEIAEEIRRR